MNVNAVELSAIEKEALAELVNIGVSRAATSLGQLLSKEVLLSVPSVEIISREAAARFVEQSSSPTLIAVQQLFEGSLSGKALLIFPETRSLELVRAILGGKQSLEDIIDLEQEVLAETGNIVLNACLGTITNVLHQTIRMSLPLVVRGTGATLFEGGEGNANLVLLLYIDFIIETQNLQGFIALLIDLPTIESLKTLVQELIEGVKQ